jgi:hypothetical protein
MAVEDQDFVTPLVESINKRLRAIDKKLEPFQGLIEQKRRLEGSRRVLLAERAATANGGGKGLSQEEVVQWMTQNRGTVHTVYQIAQGLSTTESVVRGHLNRGKDERFEKDNNQWELRDPENDDDDEDGDE